MRPLLEALVDKSGRLSVVLSFSRSWDRLPYTYYGDVSRV